MNWGNFFISILITTGFFAIGFLSGQHEQFREDHKAFAYIRYLDIPPGGFETVTIWGSGASVGAGGSAYSGGVMGEGGAEILPCTDPSAPCPTYNHCVGSDGISRKDCIVQYYPYDVKAPSNSAGGDAPR